MSSRFTSRPRISTGICPARISATIICCSTSRPTQIDAITDVIAERVRKLGGTTIRSIGHIVRLQRLLDNDAEYVTPRTCWPSCARTTSNSSPKCATLHDLCDEHGDVATTSLIEVWIDEAERRVWFLFEATRRG